MTREELKAEAIRLHQEENLSLAAISVRLRFTKGETVSSTTIRRWLNPEIAERQRVQSLAYKRRRKGVCADCGGPTHYGGQKTPTVRCARCRRVYEQTPEYRATIRRKWDPERVVEAIREWHSLYGEIPALVDWNTTEARYRHDLRRAHRFEQHDGRFPTHMTVVRYFGTWNAAIRAAGFTPRQAGGGGGNFLRRRSIQPM